MDTVVARTLPVLEDPLSGTTERDTVVSLEEVELGSKGEYLWSRMRWWQGSVLGPTLRR